LAVFQFNYLKPLSASTIYRHLSSIGCGFEIDFSSVSAAFVMASIDSVISFFASRKSSVVTSLLKRLTI